MSSLVFRLPNPAHKPVLIDLSGGNFELGTHEGNEVVVDASAMQNEGLVPIIMEKPDHIFIGRQSLGAFVFQVERVTMRILLPHESRADVDCAAGTVSISGQFAYVNAHMKAGSLRADLSQLRTSASSELRVFAGDIRFTGLPAESISYRTNRDRLKQFTTPATAEITASVTLGDIRMLPL